MAETQPDDLTTALQRGANGEAARIAAEDLPEALIRDPVYRNIYLGGLALYALLFAAFLR